MTVRYFEADIHNTKVHFAVTDSGAQQIIWVNGSDIFNQFTNNISSSSFWTVVQKARTGLKTSDLCFLRHAGRPSTRAMSHTRLKEVLETLKAQSKLGCNVNYYRLTADLELAIKQIEMMVGISAEELPANPIVRTTCR